MYILKTSSQFCLEQCSLFYMHILYTLNWHFSYCSHIFGFHQGLNHPGSRISTAVNISSTSQSSSTRPTNRKVDLPLHYLRYLSFQQRLCSLISKPICLCSCSMRSWLFRWWSALESAESMSTNTPGSSLNFL